MSTNDGEEMLGIGARLREERTRLKWSQELLATHLGTTGRTLKKYEGNETSPRAVELLQLHSLGFDVFYIVTGTRLPFGVAETRAPYTAGERLAQHMAELPLTEKDAEVLKAMADHLVSR